ncbi:hypothetical protein IWQ62_001277 [Dispira parvispora]|uniref:Uncharacterized protein n=1 Tax=Dispira parvispora TaxID=1520584 RepID=A0A9W8AVE8_9FUNG|nr:hypothetical protein IWQ62_001277 [Dispira parvispora]
MGSRLPADLPGRENDQVTESRVQSAAQQHLSPRPTGHLTPPVSSATGSSGFPQEPSDQSPPVSELHSWVSVASSGVISLAASDQDESDTETAPRSTNRRFSVPRPLPVHRPVIPQPKSADQPTAGADHRARTEALTVEQELRASLSSILEPHVQRPTHSASTESQLNRPMRARENAIGGDTYSPSSSYRATGTPSLENTTSLRRTYRPSATALTRLNLALSDPATPSVAASAFQTATWANWDRPLYNDAAVLLFSYRPDALLYMNRPKALTPPFDIPSGAVASHRPVRMRSLGPSGRSSPTRTRQYHHCCHHHLHRHYHVHHHHHLPQSCPSRSVQSLSPRWIHPSTNQAPTGMLPRIEGHSFSPLDVQAAPTVATTEENIDEHDFGTLPPSIQPQTREGTPMVPCDTHSPVMGPITTTTPPPSEFPESSGWSPEQPSPLVINAHVYPTSLSSLSGVSLNSYQRDALLEDSLSSMEATPPSSLAQVESRLEFPDPKDERLPSTTVPLLPCHCGHNEKGAVGERRARIRRRRRPGRRRRSPSFTRLFGPLYTTVLVCASFCCGLGVGIWWCKPPPPPPSRLRGISLEDVRDFLYNLVM